MRADSKCEGVIGETDKQIRNNGLNEENKKNTDGVLKTTVAELRTAQEVHKNSELLNGEQGLYNEQW